MQELEEEEDWTDRQILERIDNIIISNTDHKGTTVREMNQLRKELFYSVRKLDVLQELLEDNQITEIMVNGYKNIFLERNGKRIRWNRQFISKEKLEDVVQQIAGRCNRVINENSPIVDARLQNGSRVNAVVYPVALEGPVLTIRRFPEHRITMEWLVQKECLSKEAAEFLKALVEAGYSILVGGGTSSGKTTFLNAMSAYIPSDQRVITIEDSAELQIQGVDNLVRLESKPANMEGNKEITIRDLIRTALRMAPDRIIVGEIRGADALDFLQTANTGHDGCMCTIHANSCKDMISRIETMVLMGMELPLEAVRRQIVSGIDIMIHLGKMRDGSRRLLEISEILGLEGGEVKMHTLFCWDHKKKCVCREDELYRKEKMERLSERKDAGEN